MSGTDDEKLPPMVVGMTFTDLIKTCQRHSDEHDATLAQALAAAAAKKAGMYQIKTEPPKRKQKGRKL